MIMSPDPVVRPSLVNSALARVSGSFLSWFLFSFCLMLLVHGTFAVMAVGGSCASGGPYEIAVECPDSVAVYVPLSIFGGIFSVGIALALTRGFGTSLLDLAWPILFCGLGSGFLFAFFAVGDPIGLIIGIMFWIMGLVPLVISLRVSAQRVFLGAINSRGERFYEGEVVRASLIGMKYARSETPVAATFPDWTLSLVIWVVAAGAGYFTAQALYGAL